jgi:xylulokinase
VLGVQLVTTTAQEGPAFGAALLAGVASGVYTSVQEACETTVRVVEYTEPRPELESVYMRAYEKYRALYPALKPIISSSL